MSEIKFEIYFMPLVLISTFTSKLSLRLLFVTVANPALFVHFFLRFQYSEQYRHKETTIWTNLDSLIMNWSQIWGFYPWFSSFLQKISLQILIHAIAYFETSLTLIYIIIKTNKQTKILKSCLYFSSVNKDLS